MDMTPAQFIKNERLTKLWSVRRLSRESGVSAGYISRIETEKQDVTSRAAGRIAKALRVPPHYLFMLAGFIPEDDFQLAEDMAERAMWVPSLADQAKTYCPHDPKAWLIDDYLLLLGHDITGKGNDFGPGGHIADWQLVDPAAPASVLRQRIAEWKTHQPPPPTVTTPLEGWDGLSPADQLFIQQMVNKLRRRSAED